MAITPEMDVGRRPSRRSIASDVVNQSSLAASIGILAGSACGWFLGLMLLSVGDGRLLVRSTYGEIALILVLGSVVALASAAGLLLIGMTLSIARAIWAPVRRLDPRTVYVSSWLVGILSAHFFMVVVFRLVRDIESARGIGLLAIIGIGAAAVLIAWNIHGSRHPDHGRRRVRPVVPLVLVAAQVVIGYGAASFLRDQPWRSPLDTLPGDLPAGSVSVTRPMNVILISIDTLRPDHLSCYGYRRPTSPVIDSLASEGVLFTRARSQSPWTLPSHATMFTSLYPSSHGARNFNPVRFLKSTAIDQLPERNLTLAEILRAAGYRTSAITSVAWLGRETGVMQGFNSVDNRRQDNTASVVVDKAIRTLGNGSEPFFLFLHFMDVHDYYAPEPSESPWIDQAYRGKLATDQGLLWFRADYYDEVSKSDLDYATARYDSAVHYVDRELGRLFRWLERHDLMDSTLIVLCSDHGEELWDHGGSGHGYALWEEQLRVPLIIRPPGSFPIAHHRTTASAGVIDVTPTILDYLGVSRLPWMQGISLRSSVESTQAPMTRTFFAESPHTRHSWAIVRGPLKYFANRVPPFDLFNLAYLAPNIRTFYKFRDDGFYDLDEDAGERTNLANVDPGAAEPLRRELITYIVGNNPPVGVSRSSVAEASANTVEQLRSLGYIH